ncbi:CU044_5270 family protein [Nakamurella lactea]|uniref:CU044_5270 family protein n=1 Tax=Nakamurella lactea TaxID=459515 RepID=UPI000429BD09|nr:CU044_5270 family protein [Nakamurella lactea]
MSEQNPPAGGSPDGWTDAQLDAALADLYRVDEPSERALAGARAIMMGHIGAESPRPVTDDGRTGAAESAPAGARTAGDDEGAGVRPRRVRWGRRAGLAAAVAAVVAGALILPTVHWGGSTPPSAAAAAALNQAAEATTINAKDEALKPGQYQYFETDAWYMAMTAMADGQSVQTNFAALTHSRTQRWVPANWSDTWLERRTNTGEKKWILGTEAEAKKAGLADQDGPSTEPDYRGSCQSYFQDVCTGEGNWQGPTKPWIAALPRDPGALYTVLAAAAKGRGVNDDAEMLVYATDALRNGPLPADLRAALYRAMAKIPGIEIVDGSANLDGQVGVAFAIEDGIRRSETIIDPKSGAFIGERDVLTGDTDGMPAGTTLGYTAVHTAVVDKLGEAPKK